MTHVAEAASQRAPAEAALDQVIASVEQAAPAPEAAPKENPVGGSKAPPLSAKPASAEPTP